MSDVEVAATAARAAAAVLTGLRAEGRLSGRELGDAGDAAAQAAIAQVLAERRPADVVFSEEAVDDRRRLDADRVWIVDPLDGTREYGEAGRPDWAVHVALWSAGELTAAAVALPALTVITRYRDLGGAGLALSSTGVYSAHADFFNAWRQDELERLVTSCLNALRHCGRDG